MDTGCFFIFSRASFLFFTMFSDLAMLALDAPTAACFANAFPNHFTKQKAAAPPARRHYKSGAVKRKEKVKGLEDEVAKAKACISACSLPSHAHRLAYFRARAVISRLVRAGTLAAFSTISVVRLTCF